MRKLAPILIVIALLLGGVLYLQRGADSAPPVTTLSPDLAGLRAAFNADAGRIRLLMLIDPT